MNSTFYFFVCVDYIFIFPSTNLILLMLQLIILDLISLPSSIQPCPELPLSLFNSLSFPPTQPFHLCQWFLSTHDNDEWWPEITTTTQSTVRPRTKLSRDNDLSILLPFSYIMHEPEEHKNRYEIIIGACSWRMMMIILTSTLYLVKVWAAVIFTRPFTENGRRDGHDSRFSEQSVRNSVESWCGYWAWEFTRWFEIKRPKEGRAAPAFVAVPTRQFNFVITSGENTICQPAAAAVALRLVADFTFTSQCCSTLLLFQMGVLRYGNIIPCRVI